jgi:hypothetical protein
MARVYGDGGCAGAPAPWGAVAVCRWAAMGAALLATITIVAENDCAVKKDGVGDYTQSPSQLSG